MPKVLNNLTSKLLEFSKILLSHGKRDPPLLPPLQFSQEFYLKNYQSDLNRNFTQCRYKCDLYAEKVSLDSDE